MVAQTDSPRAANPFVTPATPPQDPGGEAVEPDPLWDDELHMQGPARPASAPEVDVTGEVPWPVLAVRSEDVPVICVMGLHGGAGATTVSELLGPDVKDVGTSWPVADGWIRPLPALPVIAVARLHHAGIDAAERMAHLWAADKLTRSRLVGLVLIDDAPKLLKAQKEAARRLARMTPHGWHIGWNDRWRIEPATLDSAGLRTRQVIKNVRAIARQNEQEK
jgi:hypothetical protein